MRHSILLVLGLLAVSCEEEKDYASCPFDKTLTEACTAKDDTGSTTKLTCVVTDHPQCPLDSKDLSPCLMYEGSDRFCTLSCETAGDCPGQAACLTASDKGDFCVPCSKTSLAPCPPL